MPAASEGGSLENSPPHLCRWTAGAPEASAPHHRGFFLLCGRTQVVSCHLTCCKSLIIIQRNRLRGEREGTWTCSKADIKARGRKAEALPQGLSWGPVMGFPELCAAPRGAAGRTPVRFPAPRPPCGPAADAAPAPLGGRLQSLAELCGPTWSPQNETPLHHPAF